jgi:hypothetical protein
MENRNYDIVLDVDGWIIVDFHLTRIRPVEKFVELAARVGDGSLRHGSILQFLPLPPEPRPSVGIRPRGWEIVHNQTRIAVAHYGSTKPVHAVR